ncbi:MAG: C40 family peptidase [Raineya sp.]|nr:C40 family peptidase [Raineya sp.]MDW8296928.1 C40 family peptidase [Raineya sp.]
MNKNLFFIFVMLLSGFISSCVSSKKIISSNNYSPSQNQDRKVQIEKVIQTAKTYLGTPYKYAGNDKNGIDCSGLTCKAYESIGIKLPRIAGDQTQIGNKIALQDIQEGDLVFFKESMKASNKITHVGIVSKVNEPNKDVIFIHASTSRGVIESQLFSKYWKSLIVSVVRVIK